MYRLDHPQELDNAKAFLFQTASNLSIDRIRRSALERKHSQTGEEFGQSVEETVDAQQTLHIVEAALAELPAKCRQAFTLHRHRKFVPTPSLLKN